VIRQGRILSDIDQKLDQLLEKLTISKLDNSFLLSFSILSVLFGFSNVVLPEGILRESITIGAIGYFVFSFFIGYYMGVIRDSWLFRVWGWVWMILSSSIFLAILVFLMALNCGIFGGNIGRAVLSFLGFAVVFYSLGLILLLDFFKHICTMTPTIRENLAIIVTRRNLLTPYIEPAIDQRAFRPSFYAILVLLIAGIILSIIGLL
jgi:hypothetical protein